MKATNMKEFKELIERYESITKEEIIKAAAIVVKNPFGWNYADIAQELTGYGSSSTCTLCTIVDNVCDACIWDIKTEHICVNGDNSYTYNDIQLAHSGEELLIAFKARAKYMKEVLNEN